MLLKLCRAALALSPVALVVPASAQTVPIVAGFANSPNQARVGAALDAAPLTPDTIQARGTIASLNGADRAAALANLTPSGYEVLPDVALRTGEFQEFSIRRYLSDYRRGGTGVEGDVNATRPSSRRFGAWATGQATEGRFDGNADRTRTEFGTQGVIGGVDGRFGNGSLLGVYGGYQNTDFSLSANVRRSRIKNWFAGAYGTFNVGPLYADLFGSYGEQNYEFRRGLRAGAEIGSSVPGYNLAFSSDGDRRTWVGGGTLGLSFNAGGFEIEPFGGVRYTNLKLSSVNEGNNFGAVRILRSTYESVLTNIGLRVGGAFTVSGAVVRPEVRGAWRREWLDDRERGFDYSIAGVSGGSLIRYDRSPLGRDYASVSAGFTVSGQNSPLSFVLDYNGEFDRDRRIHGITGGVRMTF